MTYQIIQQSKKREPIISIITPTYNVEDFIEEQVSSLMSQTLEEIELILIDDGSTDRTLDILKKLAKDNPKITLVTQSNSGPAKARNTGLELFRGEYVYFVDADDIVPAYALEALYTASIQEDADIVMGRSLSFNSTSSWYIAGHYNAGLFKEGARSIETNPELVYSLGPASKLYRKKIIRDLRMPETIKIGEDQPFVLEALLRSNKIYTIDQIVYNYRSRETIEASLSQIVKVNPYATFTDVSQSLFIGLPLFEKYIDNKYGVIESLKIYFDRVIRFDLWPAIREILKSKDSEAQKKVFEQLIIMNQKMPKQLFSENMFYFQMLTTELVERFTFIQREAYNEYIMLLKSLFQHMSPGTVAHIQDNIRIQDANKKMIALKRSIHLKTTAPIVLYLGKRRFAKESKILTKKAGTMFKTVVLRKILFPIYKISLPKTKILFMTNKDEKMTGTFQMIYDEISENNINKEKVFCYLKANNRSFSAQNRLLRDVASAKIIFLDDYYRQIYGLKLPEKTNVIQLWHAAGAFKKFGFGAIGSLDANTAAFEKAAHQNYSKVICSSKEIVPFYAEAFHIAEKNVLPLGVPRADKLLDQEYLAFTKTKFLNMHPEINGRKIITYAPTFRGGPAERKNFSMMLNIREFVKRFSDEYVLVIKMHPSVSKSQGVPYDLEEHVLNLSGMDMNDLLIVTDILVTDYSSVIFDYSLLKRPMIFFAYDLENYLAERNFYYEYRKFVPGPIVANNDSLFQAIEMIEEQDLTKVVEFRDRFFDELDGKSAQRIVKEVLSL